jgi:hypothetical protein
MSDPKWPTFAIFIRTKLAIFIRFSTQSSVVADFYPHDGSGLKKSKKFLPHFAGHLSEILGYIYWHTMSM